MKYKSERYITQREGKNGLWSFQVLIRTEGKTFTKTFNEKEYGSARVAFDLSLSYRNQKLEEIRNKTVFKSSKITVRELFEEYLQTTTDSYKTKTRQEGLFNNYVTCKDVPIQDVTKAMIQKDLNALVEKCSDDTIMRVFYLWKNCIVGTALLNEYIIRDITLGIKKPASHLIQIKRGTTTDRETITKVEDIILNSGATKYRKKMVVGLIEMLYYTGMRPGEAIVLRKDDIHFVSEGSKYDYISITKELGSNMEKLNVIRRCKTPTSIRNIPISPMLKPIINDLLNTTKSNEYIFVKEDGSWMTPTWVGNLIRYYLKRDNNNLEFNLYRLRHNMATELISNNVDSRTTMDILGHSSFNMSLYYANSSEEQKEKALEILS